MDGSYLVVVGSLFVFQLLFHVISPRLSTLLSWGYTRLSQAQKTEWHSRCVSTIHALVVGSLALYILWFDDDVNRDRIWGDPRLVKVNIAIASGYLINDLMLLLWHWKTLGDRYFISHHLAALYAYQYVLARGLLPYFANFRLIAELSTPFVNQRSVLHWDFLTACLSRTLCPHREMWKWEKMADNRALVKLYRPDTGTVDAMDCRSIDELQPYHRLQKDDRGRGRRWPALH
ncbi:TLC domain-containing protein 4-B-like isoform X2 [Mobula birostris]|uniref:TLC domain-containing protein 4-B-like isoform X2 n=1 Tax=Mobula birostris TaxID=1983395 RepID=UPI003B27FA8C